MRAKAAGASVLAGGSRERAVVLPTVLTRTRAGTSIEDEEVFGPVLTVNPFTTFDEAVTRANATRYGLQGGLFHERPAPRFQGLGDVGRGRPDGINDVPIYRIDNMPFGG